MNYLQRINSPGQRITPRSPKYGTPSELNKRLKKDT